MILWAVVAVLEAESGAASRPARAVGTNPPTETEGVIRFGTRLAEVEVEDDETVVRRRVLEPVDREAIPATEPSTRVEFDLFPDTRFVGAVTRVERLAPDRAVVFGSLDDGSGEFILASHGDALAGHFHSPGRGQYRIRPAADGNMVAEQWDPAKLPPCSVGHDHEQPMASVPTAVMAENRARTELHRLIRASASAPTEGSVYNGSGQQGGSAEGLSFTEIDVMVVHTVNARNAAGGSDGMGALIDLAMARANSVFINSEVGIRLRLVRVEEVAYTEINHDTDLVNIRQGNGAFAPVSGWRDASGTDLVALLVAGGGGKAYLYDGSANADDVAYSVSGINGVESTLVHEIGHNLGLRHDRENDSTANPLYSYSHGWRFTPAGGSELRTVMAYAPGNPIPYFSNPDVDYMGAPTGVPIGEPLESDNAQALRNTKDAIAAFRGPPGNTPPVVSFDSPGYDDPFLALDDVELAATASDAEGAVAEVRFYRLMSDQDFPFSNRYSTVLGTDAAAPFALTESEAPAGFWTYAVAAFDGNGAYGFDTVSVDIAPHYRRTTHALPAGELRAEVEAIGPVGRIVGFGHNGNPNAVDVQAVYWENSAVTTLPPLSGDTGARAMAVDPQGVVYGESISSGGVRRAVRWDEGVVSDLSALISGFTAETVVGVDELGRLYFRGDDDGDPFDDYRRFDDPGTVTPATNENWESVATTGTFAAGRDYDFGVNAWRAMRWNDTGNRLDTLAGYTSSWGFAINRSGAVAGISSPSSSGWNSTTSRATFWAAGSTTPVDLGTFGDVASIAYGLNDFNHVVGSADDPVDDSQAFIWKGQGDLINLNRVILPDGGTLRVADAINNRGQIAGTGFIGSDQVVFFLDPLPGLDHDYWLGRHFSPAELENPALTADDASPSGDGVPNLFKRAAGLDPRRSVLDHPEDADAFPRMELDAQGHVLYTLRRLRVPGDLNYEPLATLDLTDVPWRSDLFEIVDVTYLSNDLEEVTLRSVDPLTTLEQVFLHLNLSR